MHITLPVQCRIHNVCFVCFLRAAFGLLFLFSRKIIGLIINQLQNNCKKYLHRIDNLFYLCTHKTTTKHYENRNKHFKRIN